ncbi:DUF975 family protein [Arcticibacterium luteifluviistationis]|uniref:DUF975 domain-containing protein n=1 Tax=Arcticibacterium luteifluviistationis TaxID=1784714 RepID=A0A2Z4G869_9BACT|nr:DUF975 family protein [Arcticibacterium luteifluviistationis]AWV97381.1 hypothetical protein DJ013_04015 [Arcticibacterium luteifluviistationis]
MNNLDIISKSRDLLSGKWIPAIAVVIIFSLISSLPNRVNENLSFIGLILGGPLNLGLAIFFQRTVRGQQSGIENLFDGFSNYLQSTIAFILVIVVVCIGFVLLIIPGIMMAMGLSQTFFIMADDNKISGIDAMKKSWEMMDGYKMKYFLLSLIHIGMMILGMLALIVGIFYALPIIYNSMALFYDKLKMKEL